MGNVLPLHIIVVHLSGIEMVKREKKKETKRKRKIVILMNTKISSYDRNFCVMRGANMRAFPNSVSHQ